MRKVIIFVVVVALFGGLLAGCGRGTTSAPPKPKTSNVTVVVSNENGNALSSVNLTMGNYSGKTDDNGKYVFHNVKPGTYTVKATEDGYESMSSDVTVTAGEDKTVTLTLKKTEQMEELKDYSKVKSYKAVMELKQNNKVSKYIIIQDNYGKSQHITAYNVNGGEKIDLYVIGNKAKIYTDGNWIELPASQVGPLTAGYLKFLKNILSAVEDDYNGSINTSQGSGSYSVKREGKEEMNGYSTTRYRLSGKETSGEEKTVGSADIWIINEGLYKGYATRIVVNITNSTGEKSIFTINATELGKDMEIKMP